MEESEKFRRFCAEGGYTALNNRVLLSLTGSDVERFLNGQISNRLPSGAETVSACVANAKGKLDALVHVTRIKDGFLLDADPSLSESLPLRLERYIISDDVQIEDVSTRYMLLHFVAPCSIPLPDPEEKWPELECRLSTRLGVPGLDVFLPAGETLEGLDQYLHLDEAFTERIRIENGVPKWGHELDGSVLPPEAGLNHTAIDYHKGCYIGQEVISRLKSVGHVNRTLCLLTSAHCLPAGTLLSDPVSHKTVGHITSSTKSFILDKATSLGYVKRGWEKQGTMLNASEPNETPPHGAATINTVAVGPPAGLTKTQTNL